MDWFYAQGRTQIGPVNQETFEKLLKTGQITPNTLVWRPGMDNWKRFGLIADDVGYAAHMISIQKQEQTDEIGSASENSPDAVISRNGEDETILSETTDKTDIPPAAIQAAHTAAGLRSPTSDNVTETDAEPTIGNTDVTTFAMPEPTPVACIEEQKLAGIRIRGVAKLIDWTIALLISIGLSKAAAFVSPYQMPVPELFFQVMTFLFCYGLYSIFFTSRFGATPGKRLCRIRVVAKGNFPMTIRRTVVRFGAEILSTIPAGTGFIIAVFNIEKTAFHDRVADTRVMHAAASGDSCHEE